MGYRDPRERLYKPSHVPRKDSFIMRPSGRSADALRDVSLTTGFSHHAEGSCLIRMGRTEVLCAASVETRVPPFLRNSGLGWVTAEYGMLPRATHTRGDREAARGKQSGRTQEIQRLIGRSLRAVVDRAAMGEMSITLDCDVLNADGGTRCASITGAWVALSLAFRHLVKMNVLKTVPLTGQVAAVSCGIVGGEPVLDLDYDEDSSADADANFVLTDAGGLVEIQATAEKNSFSEDEFSQLLRLARTGTTALFEAQRTAIGSWQRLDGPQTACPAAGSCSPATTRANSPNWPNCCDRIGSKSFRPANLDCRSLTKPRPTSPAMPGSRHWRRRPPRACPRFPTIPVSAPPLWPASPACCRRVGPAPRRTLRKPWLW